MKYESPKLAPRIVCAAMLMDDCMVVLGVRHYSPDMRLVLKRIYGDDYQLHVKEQGFVNVRGKFLNRTDAWAVAHENAQIRHPNVSTPGTLYSENLY